MFESSPFSFGSTNLAESWQIYYYYILFIIITMCSFMRQGRFVIGLIFHTRFQSLFHF